MNAVKVTLAALGVTSLLAATSISNQTQLTPQTPGIAIDVTPQPSACVNAIRKEPVIIYDSTGSTLTGLIHRRMTVFNDGEVTVSKKTTSIFGPDTISADFTTVPQAEVKELIKALIKADALERCDQSSIVFDIPLQTLTFMPRADTDARAHTFSWWTEHFDVSQIINGFLEDTFPGF